VADRPTDPDVDRDFRAPERLGRRITRHWDDYDLPTYVGPLSFMKLPWVTDPAELRRRAVDVAIIGAPFDDAVTPPPGARFGPRAIRAAQYTSGSINSLQLDVEPFEVLDVVDAGDANIVPAWIERAHAMIYRKVREVAGTGAIPIVLGGDHSITWPQRDRGRRSPAARQHRHRPFRRPRRHRGRRLGRAGGPRDADAAADRIGRREGRNLRPGRPARLLAARRDVPVDAGAGLRYHFMREIEERGAEAVIAQAIDEALDGPDYVYLSLDIDVIDPGLAPGTGTPEPGGMLTREVLRAIRQIVAVGRPRRHGRGRGLAAVRPCRDDRDGREPGGARGDQRARRPEARGQAGPLGGAAAHEASGD
jgi:agmatinase